MKKKFSGSESVNMTPFAENTLLLLSELDYGMSPEDIAVAQKYMDLEDPNMKELRSLVLIQRTFLKGIVEYSLKIVALGQSNLSDREQAKAYHDYLRGLVEWFVKTGQDRGSPTTEQYKAVLEKVVAAQDLLSGLRAAQPLILRFNEINLALAQEIAKIKAKVVEKTLVRIDQEFEGTVGLALTVHREKEKLAKVLQKSIENDSGASLKEKSRRYEEADELSRVVATNVTAYLSAKTLISRVVQNHDDMIRRGGKTIYLWTNAHKKMASGIKNPAEWFPLTDVSTLVGAAKKSVMPF
ncbi:MAG: hypothetical protein IPN19_01385 [Elusimicrobia bacterium]|nr:hypothetical protein [Elusimicrobiota bacterium]